MPFNFEDCWQGWDSFNYLTLSWKIATFCWWRFLLSFVWFCQLHFSDFVNCISLIRKMYFWVQFLRACQRQLLWLQLDGKWAVFDVATQVAAAQNYISSSSYEQIQNMLIIQNTTTYNIQILFNNTQNKILSQCITKYRIQILKYKIQKIKTKTTEYKIKTNQAVTRSFGRIKS